MPRDLVLLSKPFGSATSPSSKLSLGLVSLNGHWGKNQQTVRLLGYEQVRVLQRVKLYPGMVEWLERSDLDGDETTDLWGYYKVTYTLKDLERWLDEKQREADRKDRKVTRSQKGSQRGKDDNGDGDESTSLSPKKSLKKSHKKSAGGRKK